MTPEEFYARYPGMRPYRGTRYGEPGRPRLLLVGESHYLPELASAHHDAAAWYRSDAAALREEERVKTGSDDEWSGWIDTAGVVTHACTSNFANPAHWIWKNAFRVINQAGPRYREARTVGEDVAFFNFFLRPALRGDSLRGHLTDEDLELANRVFEHRLDELQPTAIVFLSRLAANRCASRGRLNVPCLATPHPTSHWWNRASAKYGGRCGRELLSEFVATHLRWEAAAP